MGNIATQIQVQSLLRHAIFIFQFILPLSFNCVLSLVSSLNANLSLWLIMEATLCLFAKLPSFYTFAASVKHNGGITRTLLFWRAIRRRIAVLISRGVQVVNIMIAGYHLSAGVNLLSSQTCH